MSEPKLFEWSLRLFDGRYLRGCKGVEWQDAARAAGIEPEQVRRALPTFVVLTPEEREAQALRLKALRKRKEIDKAIEEGETDGES